MRVSIQEGTPERLPTLASLVSAMMAGIFSIQSSRRRVSLEGTRMALPKRGICSMRIELKSPLEISGVRGVGFWLPPSTRPFVLKKRLSGRVAR